MIERGLILSSRAQIVPTLVFGSEEPMEGQGENGIPKNKNHSSVCLKRIGCISYREIFLSGPVRLMKFGPVYLGVSASNYGVMSEWIGSVQKIWPVHLRILDF